LIFHSKKIFRLHFSMLSLVERNFSAANQRDGRFSHAQVLFHVTKPKLKQAARV